MAVYSHNEANKNSILAAATLSAKIKELLHQIICSSISLGTHQRRVASSFNNPDIKLGMHSLSLSMEIDNNPHHPKCWTTPALIDRASFNLDVQLILCNLLALTRERQT